MSDIPGHPYTPANVQAIADALSIPRVQLSTLYVSLPDTYKVRGESTQTFPIAIAVPIENALQETAQHYYALIDGINNRPRGAAIGKALKAMRHNAESLLNAMQAFGAAIEGLDDASREVVWQQAQPPVAGLERLARLTDQAQRWDAEVCAHLPWLIGLLDTAIQNLGTDRGGRPSDTALHIFIRRLIFFYQCATGRPPGVSRRAGEQPSGPLFRFIRTCLAPLIPHWGEECNAQALYGHIRTVLRAHKGTKASRAHRS
jgi:hypothetical protein